VCVNFGHGGGGRDGELHASNAHAGIEGLTHLGQLCTHRLPSSLSQTYFAMKSQASAWCCLYLLQAQLKETELQRVTAHRDRVRVNLKQLMSVSAAVSVSRTQRKGERKSGGRKKGPGAATDTEATSGGESDSSDSGSESDGKSDATGWATDLVSSGEEVEGRGLRSSMAAPARLVSVMGTLQGWAGVLYVLIP
jgi:hypothetical protein